MSEANVDDSWFVKPLGELAEPRRGITYSSEMLEAEEGLPYINMKSFNKGGGFNPDGTKTYAGVYAPSDLVGERDLLIANTDVTAGDIVGVPALLPPDIATSNVLYSHHVTRLRLNDEISVPFLYYLLCLPEYRSQMRRIARGTTVMMLDMQAIKRISIRAPKAEKMQQRIVRILSTLDEAIEQTQALVTKLQHMKAGLMHDLFSRGVTPDGRLRPRPAQAPDLYQKSRLGSIPKVWEVRPLAKLYRSPIRDFGSFASTNLITFLDSGVPFIKSEMIGAGEINWEGVMFISERVHQLLNKSHVRKGIILFSKIGSALGKAVIYDGSRGECNSNAAVAKIDIDPGKADKRFIMHFLNHDTARVQLRRIIVSLLPRINLGDIDRLLIPVPRISEQNLISERISASDSVQRIEKDRLAKLRQEKQGLMHDLLTGHVRVPID
jgi:type I restriction enzyme S subunit